MDIEIDGIDDIVSFFKREPDEIRSKALGKALQAAAEPIQTEVQARTPVSEIPHASEPIPQEDGTVAIALYDHLKDAITTWVAITEKGGQAKIGFGDMGYIARLIEYGHELKGHLPLKKDLGKFIEGIGFMRKGVAASTDDSIEAFTAVIEAFYGGDSGTEGK